MRLYIALVVIAALGCSSASSEPSGGTCVAPTGTYLLHHVEHADGTCGPLADQLVQADAGSGGSTCTTNASSSSADHCKDNTTITCGAIRVTTVCNWTKDASSASCIQTINDSGAGCTSTYDVSLTRQ